MLSQVTSKGHGLMCRTAGRRCNRSPEALQLRKALDRARSAQSAAGTWVRDAVHEGFTQDGAGRWHPVTDEARALTQAAQDARCEPTPPADAPYPWPKPGESWQQSTVVDYESHLREKFGPGVLIYVSATATPLGQTHLTLDKIIVHDGHRGQGLASAVLAELVRDADANGWALGLSPTDEYGTPLEVLERFYGRYGFRPNPDRLRTKREREQVRNFSKKFRYSGSSMLYVEKMVRPPNGGTIAPNDWPLQIRQRRERGTQKAVDLFDEMNSNGRTASHVEVLAELRERERFVLTEAELVVALRLDAEKRTAA